MEQQPARARARLARIFDSPSCQLMAMTFIVGTVILAAFSYGEFQSYKQAVTRVERDTRNAAHLLAEHAARTFEGIDETLRAVGRLRADTVRGIYRSQASIYVHLKTLHGGSPFMSEVGWFDSYGVRVATSAQLDPSRVGIADQEFFRVHRDGEPSSGLYIGAPFRLPDGSGWRIAVSRRLENLDGSFAGVAAGTFDPEEFASLYRSLDLGPGHSMMLVRDDGVVLAHASDAGALLGRSVADGTHFHELLRRGAGGSYRTGGGLQDAVRVGSFATVPRLERKLIVDVNVARAAALADFWTDFALDCLVATFALVVLVVGAWLLAGGLRRRERLQHDLAAATEAANHARAAAEYAQAEAEEANRAKSEFLARMSHELRTPLNAVIGFAQMLEIDPAHPLTQRQKDYSRHILEGGEHLLNLVNEVLDLAGVEAGRLPLKLERVPVAAALAGAVDIMAPVAGKAGIGLRLEPAHDISDVRADDRRLKQVLINLVANAVKYNKPGGAVTVSAHARADGFVRLSVADTGIGIPPERRKDMFKPFGRVGAEYGAIEGTGLGLALARRLVEAMGGAIDYASEPGVGSTFWIDLVVESGVERLPARRAAAG